MIEDKKDKQKELTIVTVTMMEFKEDMKSGLFCQQRQNVQERIPDAPGCIRILDDVITI